MRLWFVVCCGGLFLPEMDTARHWPPVSWHVVVFLVTNFLPGTDLAPVLMRQAEAGSTLELEVPGKDGMRMHFANDEDPSPAYSCYILLFYAVLRKIFRGSLGFLGHFCDFLGIPGIPFSLLFCRDLRGKALSHRSDCLSFAIQAEGSGSLFANDSDSKNGVDTM